MTEDYEYFANKLPDRVYISKAFDSFDELSARKLRIVSRVFDHGESHEVATVKGEVVLRVTAGQRDEVRATFYEDSREMRNLTIQRFTTKSGRPHQRTHFTFRGEEIDRLYNLLRIITHVPLYGEIKARIDDAELESMLAAIDARDRHIPRELSLELDDKHILEHLVISEDEKRKFFRDNREIVLEIFSNEITWADVATLAYRKRQLDRFEQLLEDHNYFDARVQELGNRGEEAVWQEFFEDNPWIFGYGLNYIFTSRLDNRKLEQVVAGSYLGQSGKRVDALMKTRGLISSLCFVEIKTHKTPLLHDRSPYRTESWRVSTELAGGVSQVQKTAQKAVETIWTKLELSNAKGDPTGEYAFLYQPKAYLVIGSLEQFSTAAGVNEQKFSSFELFRRNIVNPEIITYDELFERACFIVQHSEGERPFTSDDYGTQDEEDEVPF